jgi:hypothetical protein
MNLETFCNSFFTQPILWVFHVKSDHNLCIKEPTIQLKTQLCNSLWACCLHYLEHLSFMMLMHMIVNTLNTSTMMELVNIECQKWKAIKVYLILMCSANDGQSFNMMLINSNELRESKIFVLSKRVNIQLIYLSFYRSHHIKKIIN